jgi:LysM repeat protein
MPILKQGSKNSSVLVLQQYLESLGLFSGATSDIFSSRITDAVKVFQIHNNLNPDGIVGAKTWRALIASVNLPPDSAVSAQSTPRVDSRYQYITHKVESGDNLWILAQKYGTTVDDIKTASGIVSNYLTIGQVLTVPVLVASDTGSVNPAQVAPSQNPDTPVLHPPPTPTPPSGGNEYTVKSGDSLWILSKRFGTTIDAIKAASGITSDALSIGQRLVIPIH